MDEVDIFTTLLVTRIAKVLVENRRTKMSEVIKIKYTRDIEEIEVISMGDWIG